MTRNQTGKQNFASYDTGHRGNRDNRRWTDYDSVDDHYDEDVEENSFRDNHTYGREDDYSDFDDMGHEYQYDDDWGQRGAYSQQSRQNENRDWEKRRRQGFGTLGGNRRGGGKWQRGRGSVENIGSYQSGRSGYGSGMGESDMGQNRSGMGYYGRAKWNDEYDQPGDQYRGNRGNSSSWREDDDDYQSGMNRNQGYGLGRNSGYGRRSGGYDSDQGGRGDRGGWSDYSENQGRRRNRRNENDYAGEYHQGESGNRNRRDGGEYDDYYGNSGRGSSGWGGSYSGNSGSWGTSGGSAGQQSGRNRGSWPEDDNYSGGRGRRRSNDIRDDDAYRPYSSSNWMSSGSNQANRRQENSGPGSTQSRGSRSRLGFGGKTQGNQSARRAGSWESREENPQRKKVQIHNTSYYN